MRSQGGWHFTPVGVKCSIGGGVFGMPGAHLGSWGVGEGDGSYGVERVQAGYRVPGVIGRTTSESSPAWPQPVRAAADAPNVVFIVLDDTGFGQLGCYGGPISTPNLDALAAGGCCAPTCTPRRCAHPRGRASSPGATTTPTRPRRSTRLATGYPGYNGSIPFENVLVRDAVQHGYNTYMIGGGT